MAKKWEVMALNMGTFSVKKSDFLYGAPPSDAFQAPTWAAAVYCDDKKILVDTGIRDATWINPVTKFNQPEKYTMISALKNGPGWVPEDVDLVINTHLHFDHSGTNYLFKNAKFVIQKREWENAYNPDVSQGAMYMEGLFDKSAVNYLDWVFVDGETQIEDGLSVVPTPGHTKGHQSVFVNTQEGVLCIAGDICNMVENLTGHYPPGIIFSVEDARRSFLEIARRAHCILPGHEPKIKDFQTTGFPTI